MSANTDDTSITETAAPRFYAAAMRAAGVVLYQESSGTLTANAGELHSSRFDQLLEAHVSRFERAWQSLADS